MAHVPDLGCHPSSSCQNTPGSYTCHCPPGRYGVHCRQREESCTAGGPGLCGQGRCLDQAGSPAYTCICHEGWTTGPGSPACNVDIDECAAPDPPCSK